MLIKVTCSIRIYGDAEQQRKQEVTTANDDKKTNQKKKSTSAVACCIAADRRTLTAHGFQLKQRTPGCHGQSYSERIWTPNTYKQLGATDSLAAKKTNHQTPARTWLPLTVA